MRVILKDINLVDDMMDTTVNENVRKERLALQINKYLYYIDQILNTNLNDISDEELYTLLSNIYEFKLNKYDYLKMLYNKYGVKYDNFIHIKTCMTVKEKSGKVPSNLNLGNDIYCYKYYIVAKKEGLNLKDGCEFLKHEFKNFIDYNLLVPVYEYSQEIVRSEGIRLEKYDPIPVDDIGICDYIDYSGEVCNDENAKYFMSLVREQKNNFNILDDLKMIVMELDEQLDELIYENKDEHIAQLVNEVYSIKGSKLMKSLKIKLAY